ncbi:transcriptional repressor CTCFL [Papilio machaon]|uniref:transcriptional repressor CTCFL n=1 Tax=Papilio machaon TaxID=76193 RepID=UPI001E663F34|nr:transcriptional repressor CTCFL [Papilio machaon]
MTDLRIHIQKLHTSADQPFKCKICDEMFPDRYTWKIHHKTHKGEKCYKSKICSFAGCSMARLKTHMLKHMDIKPFACKQCEQRFRQKQLLRRHENLYHTPGYVRPPSKEKTHSCHECGRAFAYPGNLSRHLSFHEPKPAPSEQVVIPDRIKEVQCISGQPKVGIGFYLYESSYSI